jgi:hypothetical protein
MGRVDEGRLRTLKQRTETLTLRLERIEAQIRTDDGAVAAMASVLQPLAPPPARAASGRPGAAQAARQHDQGAARRPPGRGDLRRANEIRDVVLNRLTAVHDALLPEPAVGAGGPAATEAARIAAQGQLPVCALASPVPGTPDVPPKRPVERPGVQRPDRT